jgi:lipopolysaccharide transport system ATP-binding protein
MSEVLIKVDHLSKKFCRSLKRSMYYGVTDTLKTMAGVNYSTDTLRPSEFWSLNDISFELRRGESLGIIGLNGSGKSTLLRLLAGIFPPDTGHIEIKGKIGSLIAVGAGFHPHMSGKENVYLNATLLGMNRRQIDEKFNQIIAFSEIENESLEAPVSTYSSGMKVRLGFSIAIHCNTDILLVDEVLSVGDLNFKNKSLRKMSKFRDNANGLIFISHQLEQVRVVCDKLMILDKGRVVYYGTTDEGIQLYEELSQNSRAKSISRIKTDTKYVGIDRAVITHDDIELISTNFFDTNNSIIQEIETNKSLKVNIKFKAHNFIEEIYLSIGVLNDKGDQCIWLMSNDFNKVNFKDIEKGTYSLTVDIENHHLMPGVYYLNYAIRNGKTMELYEKIYTNTVIKVKAKGKQLERGIVHVSETWDLQKTSNI